MTATIETLKADLAAAQSRIADLELLNRTQLAGWEDESRRLRADILLVAGRDDDGVMLTLGSLRGEIATLSADLERVTRERDAYKRAKAENDARFMIERDEARQERDEARAKVALLPSEDERESIEHCVYEASYSCGSRSYKRIAACAWVDRYNEALERAKVDCAAEVPV